MGGRQVGIEMMIETFGIIFCGSIAVIGIVLILVGVYSG